MLFASSLSKEWKHIDEATWERIRAMLEPLATPVTLPNLSREGFTRLLMHDKKAANSTLRFVLLKGLGEAFIREGTSPEELWPILLGFMEAHPGLLRMDSGSGGEVAL